MAVYSRVVDPARDAIEAALDRLWHEGCPCAQPTMRDVVIDIGVRRWRSFERRNKRRHPTREDRVEDVAVGIHARCEPPERGRGPEMRDYRCVAEAIAGVLDPLQTADSAGEFE
jgi:hypothetical protein